MQDFAFVGKEPDGNRWNDCHYSNVFKAQTEARLTDGRGAHPMACDGQVPLARVRNACAKDGQRLDDDLAANLDLKP